MSYEQVNETNFDEIKQSIIDDFKSSNFIKKRINNDFLDFIVSFQTFLTKYLVLENLKKFSFVLEKKVDFDGNTFELNDFVVKITLAKRGPASMNPKEFFGSSKTLGSYKIGEFDEYFPKANLIYVDIYSPDALTLYKSIVAIDTAISLINTSSPKGLTPVDYFVSEVASGDEKILAKRFELKFSSQLFLKKLLFNVGLVDEVEFIFEDVVYEVEK